MELNSISISTLLLIVLLVIMLFGVRRLWGWTKSAVNMFRDMQRNRNSWHEELEEEELPPHEDESMQPEYVKIDNSRS